MSRPPKFLRYRGRWYTMSALAQRCGVELSCFFRRLQRGMSVQQAVERPVGFRRRDVCVGRTYGCLLVLGHVQGRVYRCRCQGCGHEFNHQAACIAKGLRYCRKCVHQANADRVRERFRVLLYRGRRYTLTELACVAGLQVGTLSHRLRQYGWSLQEAVETPLYGSYHRKMK